MEKRRLGRKPRLAILLMVLAAASGAPTARAADQDGDGVEDSLDACPQTAAPESVPTQRLGVNRFALWDSDDVFDTSPPGGGAVVASQLTLSDTRGCSCSQIIEYLELGNGHSKFGCSIGAMSVFIAQFASEPEPSTLRLLATGQTVPVPADRNDGVPGPVAVPDDGTLQLGAALSFIDNGDGTVTDVNTGLMWEKKCDVPACTETDLHYLYFAPDGNSAPRWSGDGTQDTIWDWLEQVNAEGGGGFAGHSDWRIPNIRELLSIVDYSVAAGAPLDPLFGPGECRYWSSTSMPDGSGAMILDLSGGPAVMDFDAYDVDDVCVRAVRGGL